MQYVPPSIEEIGLKNYLDKTASEHNGSNYDEFVKRVELSEPSTVIARAFSVSRHTINKWVAIYEKELSDAS